MAGLTVASLEDDWSRLVSESLTAQNGFGRCEGEGAGGVCGTAGGDVGAACGGVCFDVGCWGFGRKWMIANADLIVADKSRPRVGYNGQIKIVCHKKGLSKNAAFGLRFCNCDIDEAGRRCAPLTTLANFYDKDTVVGFTASVLDGIDGEGVDGGRVACGGWRIVDIGCVDGKRAYAVCAN